MFIVTVHNWLATGFDLWETEENAMDAARNAATRMFPGVKPIKLPGEKTAHRARFVSPPGRHNPDQWVDVIELKADEFMIYLPTEHGRELSKRPRKPLRRSKKARK